MEMETVTKTDESEIIVAVLPPRSNKEEIKLSQSVSAIELEAEAITILTDEDYSIAAKFGQKVKQAAAQVTEFFKPMKDDAYRAHRTVCEREKTMLKPLVNAETVLKRTMGEYALRRERERKAAEEEARRRAKDEADRKLAEAIKHEEAGDKDAAANAMIDAQMADTMGRNMTVTIQQPKAEGISQSKDWEVTAMEKEKIPINFVGVELRPVDEKAVIRLIRASKGSVEIPGVSYREIIKTSIRR